MKKSLKELAKEALEPADPLVHVDPDDEPIGREALLAQGYLDAQDSIESLTDNMLLFANQLGCSLNDLLTHGNTVPGLIRDRLKERDDAQADRDDLLQEIDRLHTFLSKINATTRYFVWRDERKEPGVVLPCSVTSIEVPR